MNEDIFSRFSQHMGTGFMQIAKYSGNLAKYLQLLLTLVLAGYFNHAHSNPGDFAALVSPASGTIIESNCTAGCHLSNKFERDTNIKMQISGDRSLLPDDDNPYNLEIDITDKLVASTINSSFLYRFVTTGGLKPDLVPNTTGSGSTTSYFNAVVPVKEAGNRVGPTNKVIIQVPDMIRQSELTNNELKYCVAWAEVNSDLESERRWNCDTYLVKTIPYEPPTINSISIDGVPTSFSGFIDISLDQGETLPVAVNADRGADGSPLSYTVVPDSANQLVSVSATDNSRFSISADNSASGSALIRVTVANSKDDTKFVNFTLRVTVESVNTALGATLTPSGPTVNVVEDGSLIVTMNVSNTAPGTVNYSAISSTPQAFSVSNSGNVFTVQADGSTDDQSELTFTASQANRTPVSITLFLTITAQENPNNAPTIVNADSLSIPDLTVGDEKTFQLEVQDEDIPTLTYTATSVNNFVEISHLGGGLFSITALERGLDTLSFTVTDTDDAFASASASVSVLALLVANADTEVFIFPLVTVVPPFMAALAVLDNDIYAGDTIPEIELSSLVTQAGGGVVADGDVVQYTAPDLIPVTGDSFEYLLRSGDSFSNLATVTVIPSDFDADNIPDFPDNCRYLPNTDQLDTDSDLIGDLCDFEPVSNGLLGDGNSRFDSGESLFESACASCHKNGNAGDLDLGNTEAWAREVTESSQADPNSPLLSMLNYIVQGEPHAPAEFDRRYSARELTQAMLYLTGLEDPFGTGSVFDRDGDGVHDLIDTCPDYRNTANQSDENNNGVGDVCETDANEDGLLDYSISIAASHESESGLLLGALITDDSGTLQLLANTRGTVDDFEFDWTDSSSTLIEASQQAATSNVLMVDTSQLPVGIYEATVKGSNTLVQGVGRIRVSVYDSVVTGGSANLEDEDMDGLPENSADTSLLTGDHDDNNAQDLRTNNPPYNRFYSPTHVRLGIFTSMNAASGRAAGSSGMLSREQFQGVLDIAYVDSSASSDAELVQAAGIFDVEVSELDNGVAILIIQPSGRLPVVPSVRLFDHDAGQWKAFLPTEADSLSSADDLDEDCPLPDSSNYLPGVKAGHSCLRLEVIDGGSNDADGAIDGSVAFTGSIGVSRNLEDESGNVPAVNPLVQTIDLSDRSRGGSTSGLLMLFMLVIAGTRYSFLRVLLQCYLTLLPKRPKLQIADSG